VTPQEAARIDTFVAHILKTVFGTKEPPPVTIPDVWAMLGDRQLGLPAKLKAAYANSGGDGEYNEAAVTFYNKLMAGWPVDPAHDPKDKVAACGAELQTVLATAGGQHARPLDHALQKALDEGTVLLK
jgi:hypothetical protein